MNRRYIIFFFSFFLLLTLGVVSVSAQTETTSSVQAENVSFTPLTTIPGLFNAGTPTNPISVIRGIYGIAIGIGSVIAVIMIIFGGFEYMYQESFSGKSAAKERIQNAFLGLGVIMASYIILRTINADLVNFNLSLPGSNGNLTGLVVDQGIYDQISNQMRAAANQLGEGLRNADSLAAQAESAVKAAEDIQKKQDDLLKNNPNATSTAAYQELQKQKEDLFQQGVKKQNEADALRLKTQQDARSAYVAILSDKTTQQLNELNVQGLEDSLKSYDAALQGEIKNITDNPQLTTEEKQTKIAESSQKIQTEKFITSIKLEAAKLLASDSGAINDSTRDQINDLSKKVASQGSTLLSSPYLSDETESSLRNEMLVLQQQLDLATEIANTKGEQEKNAKIKSWSASVLGPTGYLISNYVLPTTTQ